MEQRRALRPLGCTSLADDCLVLHDPERIIGGLPFSLKRFASVSDEVVGDDADVEDQLYLTSADQDPEHPPELLTVIAAQAHVPEDPAHDARRPPQVAPGQLLPRPSRAPIPVSAADVGEKTLVEIGRFVNGGNNATPAFYDCFARLQELNIGLGPSVFEDTSLAFQPFVKRCVISSIAETRATHAGDGWSYNAFPG